MSCKAKINEMHSKIITYVVSHFKNTKKYKQQIVDALNLATYSVYANEPPSSSWSWDAPFTTFPGLPDEELLEQVLGQLMLTIDGIDWSELKPTHDFMSDTVPQMSVGVIRNESVIQSVQKIREQFQQKESTSQMHVVEASRDLLPSSKQEQQETSAVTRVTPKQDLYIQPPAVPQFNYRKPWMKCVDGADSLVIYTTLPEIPTKQNEISVTTDVNKFSRRELMRLYPNQLIRTRASVMYEPLDGVELDPELGLILPIKGYTRDQLIANIIEYPHIFKLLREVDNQFYSFYTHIEIDGELHGILDIWDSLPESKLLPRNKEFVKEYVVRRYLLERDIKGIKHRYSIYGTFDAFLTLFMPADEYICRGYGDVEDIARRCVKSRVSYKQSRNPVIRRMMNHV